jgi:hypothetical protein
VVAQATGFDAFLPTGAGLLSFETLDDALEAIAELRRDYGRHARAARAIAEEFLDSDRVLTKLLDALGAASTPTRRSVHDGDEAEFAAALEDVVAVKRLPFAYRSSSPILELEVTSADGSVRTLLAKDLARESLSPRARAAKPDFLWNPLREIEAYRLLAGAGLGTPELHGAVVDPDRGRYWLLIEKVAGVELYQVGDLNVWKEVMRWLASLHDHFAAAPELEAPLLRYDRELFLRWEKRARTISGFELDGYERVADELVARPTTLLHGELYASNVLAAGGRVCAVDWELAAVGPAAIDVAAITAGWPEKERDLLIRAYREALGSPPDRDRLARDVDCARLHLAVQWLGWSHDWTPPPEHSQDWRAEAESLVRRLEL